MFDVGGGELILIVLAAILLFGPKKLPEIAQMFAKGMKKVRSAQAEFKGQINEIQSEINSVADFNINNPLKPEKPKQRPVKRATDKIELPQPDETVDEVEDFYSKQAKHESEYQNNSAFKPVNPSKNVETSGTKRNPPPPKAEEESFPDYDASI